MHYDISATFAELATWLSTQLRMPILDKSGLPGIYQFSFDYFPSGGISNETRHVISPPDPRFSWGENQAPWFAEGLEKIGVRLASAKAPLENIVIDRLDMTPTEN